MHKPQYRKTENKIFQTGTRRKLPRENNRLQSFAEPISKIACGRTTRLVHTLSCRGQAPEPPRKRGSSKLRIATLNLPLFRNLKSLTILT